MILILILIIYIFLFPIYMAMPILAKVIVFILNCFIPDPLPFVDEIFMIFAIIKD